MGREQADVMPTGRYCGMVVAGGCRLRSLTGWLGLGDRTTVTVWRHSNLFSPRRDLGHARQDPINTAPAPDSVPTSSLSRSPGRVGERVCIALYCIYLNDRPRQVRKLGGGGK